jgi:sterol desaturase/sphingolipid hydroxylase (fatty acid hydroxylase superfamily)
VEEMGYAAHLRYHFVETLVYRTIEYVPLAMIGFGLQPFIIVHLFTLAIGHLNHANIYLPLGPLKYIFNSPQMHIWHHAKDLPKGSYGKNYGISLSIWDYLFGSVWMPHDGRDIPLGFPEVDNYPDDFLGQVKKPFF